MFRVLFLIMALSGLLISPVTSFADDTVNAVDSSTIAPPAADGMMMHQVAQEMGALKIALEDSLIRAEIERLALEHTFREASIQSLLQRSFEPVSIRSITAD